MDARTDILEEIASVAGHEAATIIAENFGGATLYVPSSRRLNDSHHLVTLLGQERASLMCRHFEVNDGGIQIKVPLGTASKRAALWAQITELLGMNRSIAEIARQLKIDEKTVRRHRVRMGLAQTRKKGKRS